MSVIKDSPHGPQPPLLMGAAVDLGLRHRPLTMRDGGIVIPEARTPLDLDRPGERRIDKAAFAAALKPADPLVQIGRLLKGLTFIEMMKLSGTLMPYLPIEAKTLTAEFATGLAQAAEVLTSA